MKILIAYYSRKGIIEEIKEKIEKSFGDDAKIDIEEIKTKQEHSFLVWFFKKIFRRGCEIQEPKIKNISEYDLIYLGGPNWTGISLPLKRYLQKVEGVENKNIAHFSISTLPLLIERALGLVFLLNRAVDKLISNKGGKVIDNIIVSRIFYKKGWFFERIENKIEGFLGRTRRDISSIKDFYFEKRETKTAYLVLGFIAFLLPILIVLQGINSFFGLEILGWRDFLPIFIYSFFLFLIMIATMKIEEALPLIKYIASWTLVSMTTIILTFLNVSMGENFLILPYVFILLIVGFFKNYGSIIFTGVLSIISYLILSFYSYEIGFVTNAANIFFIGLVATLLIFFIKREEKKMRNIIKLTEGLKQEKDILTVKLKARTRQLEEQAKKLKEENRKKTEKLKEKLDEMKRFQKLTIGRELKMKELKKKIKELKKKIKDDES